MKSMTYRHSLKPMFTNLPKKIKHLSHIVKVQSHINTCVYLKMKDWRNAKADATKPRIVGKMGKSGMLPSMGTETIAAAKHSLPGPRLEAAKLRPGENALRA